ncbi:hypothetical protein ACPSL3_07685 [Vibrio owensii]|uniref:hypothetical protein n=1 Tax=Vibrio owensii TaxID=696485 RepID=UPI003CE4A90A
MMLNLFKMILTLMLFYCSYVDAGFNTVADQHLVFNVSYDRVTEQFYDISGSGSEWIEITETEPGVFVFMHGRDGYKGAVVPRGTPLRYSSSSGNEPGAVSLLGAQKGGNITIETGRKNASLWLAPLESKPEDNTENNGGCLARATTSQAGVASSIFVESIQDPFLNRWCLSGYYVSRNSSSYFPTDIRQVGYIERMFKLDKLHLKDVAYDSYTGFFSIVGSEFLRTGWAENLDPGREAYHYTVNVHIKPSIQQFDIDQSVLDLKVARVNGRIIGEGLTGFTASGSFDKYQPFTVTVTSLNACGSKLCLMNGSLSIPYEIDVFDPVTLLKKRVTTSGGSITINADREHEMNGTLGFKFDVTDNGQSGVYSDVATVRLALVL